MSVCIIVIVVHTIPSLDFQLLSNLLMMCEERNPRWIFKDFLMTKVATTLRGMIYRLHLSLLANYDICVSQVPAGKKSSAITYHNCALSIVFVFITSHLKGQFTFWTLGIQIDMDK